MYRIPIVFYNRLKCGEVPVSYIVISTHMGYRAYAEKELTKIFDVLGCIADGSYLADSTSTAGSVGSGVIEKSGRVISFGTFERELQALREDILSSYQSKTLQHMSIEVDNTDRHFAKLIASEPFVGRSLKYYIGFEADPQSEHLQIFSGIITEISVMPAMTIEANEE